MRQRLLQDGPLHSCPTDDLLIDLPTACLAESIQLQGEVLVAGADPSIANLHGTPQKLEILVGFSREKRNQFFEHKDACKPPKNQESIRTGKTVRQNGPFFLLTAGERSRQAVMPSDLTARVKELVAGTM